MFSDVLSYYRAGFGEHWIGFRPSFDRASLDPARAITDALLGNEDKQAVELVLVVDTAGVMSPCDSDLHGMLEAELARQSMGQQRGLGHHQANKIIGKQIDPDFLDHHCGRLAAQVFHPQCGLDVA